MTSSVKVVYTHTPAGQETMVMCYYLSKQLQSTTEH